MIKIDTSIIPLNDIKKLYTVNINNKLKNIKPTNKKERIIIDCLTHKYPNFFLKTPEENAKTINFNFGWTQIGKDNKGKDKIELTDFGKKICNALNYDEFKGKLRPLITKLNVKTCPYCNMQLTLSTKGNNFFYELDHFWPQSKYPHLSISFYNLVPSCKPCNHRKSAKGMKWEEAFHPYRNDLKNISPFSFKIPPESLVKFALNNNIDDIIIDFEKNKNYVENNFDAGKHNTMYHICDKYNTQKDVVEEILWKRRVYSKERKDELLAQFGDLFQNQETINRLILGNYPKESEILKRPLAKFTQDIAKQVGLLEE